MDLHQLCLLTLLAALLVLPAGAFEAGALEVTIAPTGDAQVELAYGLSWIERVGVYLAIAAPEQELGTVLSRLSGRDVRIDHLGQDRVRFTVPHFARVDRESYTTPRVDFAVFGRLLDRYWFAPLVRPDLSPSSITLTFPDGHRESLPGGTELPAVVHRG